MCTLVFSNDNPVTVHAVVSKLRKVKDEWFFLVGARSTTRPSPASEAIGKSSHGV